LRRQGGRGPRSARALGRTRPIRWSLAVPKESPARTAKRPQRERPSASAKGSLDRRGWERKLFAPARLGARPASISHRSARTAGAGGAERRAADATDRRHDSRANAGYKREEEAAGRVLRPVRRPHQGLSISSLTRARGFAEESPGRRARILAAWFETHRATCAH